MKITIEEFARNFPGYEVPTELSLLLAFEHEHGRERYAEGFCLTTNGEAHLMHG
jgi:hypothetical protein